MDTEIYYEDLQEISQMANGRSKVTEAKQPSHSAQDARDKLERARDEANRALEELRRVQGEFDANHRVGSEIKSAMSACIEVEKVILTAIHKIENVIHRINKMSTSQSESISEAADPSEKKKFLTTLKTFLDKKLHREYQLKSMPEDTYSLELGDILADEKGLEKFLEDLTEFFYSMKKNQTYRTLAPNWEEESQGNLKIFFDPQFDESGFYEESVQKKSSKFLREDMEIEVPFKHEGHEFVALFDVDAVVHKHDGKYELDEDPKIRLLSITEKEDPSKEVDVKLSIPEMHVLQDTALEIYIEEFKGVA